MNITQNSTATLENVLLEYLTKETSETQAFAFQNFYEILCTKNEETIIEVIEIFKKIKRFTQPNNLEQKKRESAITAKIIDRVRELAILKAERQNIQKAKDFLEKIEGIFFQTSFTELRKQMILYPNRFC